MVGIAHVRRALTVQFEDRAVVPVSAVMVPPVFLPDSVELDNLLDTLSEGNLQIAVLIDEFGDLAGLVTLEDLVEEIVGEVRDEHDTDETTPHHDLDGTWIVPGGMRPDEATDLIGVPVPDSEDYDTLAGLILVTLGRLARVGDRVTVPTVAMPGSPPWSLELEVTAVDELRIDQVRITLPPAPERPTTEKGHRPSTDNGRGRS